MTVALVFFTFLLFGFLSVPGRTKREIVAEDSDAEGLKEVFPFVPENRKLCRYCFSGDLKSNYVCPCEFECRDCAVHKRLAAKSSYSYAEGHTVKDIGGILFSSCLFYGRGHTCVEIVRNGYVAVGIDSFVLKTIGEKADRVLLPDVGDFVEASEIGFAFVVDGVHIPLISPVSGEVVQINPSISRDMIGKMPFVWLFVLKPFELMGDLQSLLYGIEAENWLKSEVEQLKSAVVKDKSFAADGGNLNFSSLDIDFEEFRCNFLFSYKR